MKGLEFSDWKNNSRWTVDGENLYIHVDLSADGFMSKNEKPMAAQCFVNFVEDRDNGRRIFGNLNLSIGIKKAALRDENNELKRRLLELEAKLNG